MEKDGATIPRVGLVSIVTDGFGIPQCAIETVRVDRVRFADAPPEIAQAEAEGDATFDDWRDGHRAYFQREARRLGLTFDDDAVIFCEHFRLLKVLGVSDPEVTDQ